VVPLAVGIAVYAVAALTAEQRWFEQVSAPLSGTGLSRVASSFIVDSGLLPQHDFVAPQDARDALIIAADGTPLVGERLVQYSTDREAELAIGHARRASLARTAFTTSASGVGLGAVPRGSADTETS